MAVLYSIKNRKTGKEYIGMSSNVKHRWTEHRCNMRNGKQHPLYDSMRKHGESSFIFSILKDNIPDNEVGELEKELIQERNSMYPNGYNLAEGGTGGNTRKYLSDKRLEEVSISYKKAAKLRVENEVGLCGKMKKGKHFVDVFPESAEQWRKNHTSAMKKVSERRQAGNFTEKELEGYKALSIRRSGGSNPRAAKIRCIQTGEIFGSMIEAVKHYGLNSRTPIQRTIKLKKPSSNFDILGLEFEYVI